MSHALFSILPLMIGVFGGTISVIVVIKSVGNQRVEDNLQAIKSMIHKLLGESGFNDSNNSRVCNYRDKVEYCRKAFANCTLYPVILFTIWIIMVSFCVSLNGKCIKALNSPHDNKTTKFASDESQTKELASSDSNLPREVMDSMTELFGSVLLGAKSIFIITTIDSLFIIASLIFLRRAKTQYLEVRKIYHTIMGTPPEDDETFQKTGGKTD